MLEQLKDRLLSRALAKASEDMSTWHLLFAVGMLCFVLAFLAQREEIEDDLQDAATTPELPVSCAVKPVRRPVPEPQQS